MTNTYDAIVVGARCGGSPTAMLLARRGYRVLLLDKATFPSDTMSTHFIHPPGVAALERWGLLDRLRATGCPPVEGHKYDFGPIAFEGSPRPVEGVSTSYGPRRSVLDALLVEAAVEAGAELREGFAVDEILFEGDRVTGIRGHDKGRKPVTEHAAVVIGADGKHSTVAKAVGPEQYNEQPTLQAAYYAYWSDLPAARFEVWSRDEHGTGWGVIPTHDDLTCVVVGHRRSEFDRVRKDIEKHYVGAFELAPEFAERVRAATRETRFVGSGELPNFFRRPYGPGWVLVGDAGYHKDPITAWGMSDAFRDAEAVAAGLDDVFAGRRPFAEAMGGYQRARDEASLPMFELTTDLARLEPPPPEMQELIGAVSQSPEHSDGFVSVMAGTLPVQEFFAPENAGRIMAAADAGAAA